MKRRKFFNYGLKSLGILSLSSPLMFLSSCQQNNLDIRKIIASNDVLKYFRVLNGQRALEGDKELINKLKILLSKVTLAYNQVEFSTEDLMEDKIIQFSNIKLDTNGYRVKITNKNKLRRILDKAQNKSEAINAKYPNGFEKVEILWGSFFWNKQIRPEKGTLDKNKLFPKFIAEEVYWLDIWCRVNGYVVNLFRVYFDSLTFNYPHRIPDEVEELPKLSEHGNQIFVDDNKIILHWHDLVKKFNIERNIFYLRACFGNSETEYYKIFGTSASNNIAFEGLVYPTVESSNSRDFRFFELDYSEEIQSQVHKFRWLLPTQMEEMRNSSYALVSRLNVDSIHYKENEEFSDTLRQFIIDVSKPFESNHQIMKNLLLDWKESVKNFPIVDDIPKPLRLDENKKASQDFIYFISQVIPSAQYISNGYFQVSFESGSTLASTNGERGSSWKHEIKVVLGGGAATVTTVNPAYATSSGAAAVTHELLDNYVFDRSEERRKNLNELDRYVRSVCTGDQNNVMFTDDCEKCARESEVYRREMGDLASNLTMEGIADVLAGTAAGAGMGCLVGAAIGLVGSSFLGGIAGPATCFAGAIVGAIFGAFAGVVELWSDYQEYKEQVQETKDIAFKECQRLLMVDVGEPVIIN